MKEFRLAKSTAGSGTAAHSSALYITGVIVQGQGRGVLNRTSPLTPKCRAGGPTPTGSPSGPSSISITGPGDITKADLPFLIAGGSYAITWTSIGAFQLL